MSDRKKTDIIKALYKLKNTYALDAIGYLISCGYTYVRFIDPNDPSDKNKQIYPLTAASTLGVEFLMGLHEREISFSPTTDYPQLKIDYSGIDVDIDLTQLDYTTVYTLVGKARPHAPEFLLNGIVVFHGKFIDIFLSKDIVSNISVISQQELLQKAVIFTQLTGNTKEFSYGQLSQLCSTNFHITRNAFPGQHTRSLPKNKISLQKFVDFGIAVRRIHENISFFDDASIGDMKTLKWKWCEGGKLKAMGRVVARYDGTKPEDMPPFEADPLLSSLLSDDEEHRDISYDFEYVFEFNEFGRIKKLTITRDEEQMEKCYRLNSSDIDSILQLASNNARANDRSDLSDKIMFMSKALLEKEQKELALTDLLSKIEKASPEQKEYLIEALGDALYKVAKNHY